MDNNLNNSLLESIEFLLGVLVNTREDKGPLKKGKEIFWPLLLVCGDDMGKISFFSSSTIWVPSLS